MLICLALFSRFSLFAHCCSHFFFRSFLAFLLTFCARLSRFCALFALFLARVSHVSDFFSGTYYPVAESQRDVSSQATTSSHEQPRASILSHLSRISSHFFGWFPRAATRENEGHAARACKFTRAILPQYMRPFRRLIDPRPSVACG